MVSAGGLWRRHLLSPRGRRVTIALAAIAGAALAPGLLRLETDNSPRVFLVRGSPAVERYASFQRLFGTDKIVRIAVSGAGLWTPEGLAALRRLEEAAEAEPGVAAASGLAGHFSPRGGAWPPTDPEAFRRRVLADPLARDLGWIDAEGSTATLLVAIGITGNRRRQALLERLEDHIAAAVPRPEDVGLDLRLVGAPVLDAALDVSTREVERRYFPLLVGLTLVLLVAVFRRPAAVMAPLGLVAATELAALGLMGWAGVRLNLVLAVLPPLLFAIALATAVHLLVRKRDFLQAGESAVGATISTYRNKGWAVLWTGVSTFIGFTALALSRVGPVRSLGLWAGLGIAAMTLFAFTLYPALLSGAGGRADTRVGRRRFEGLFRRHGRRWAEWAARRRRWVLALAAVLSLAALAGVPRLRLETNALHYLAEDHPARAEIETLESRGVGTAAVELMLARPAGEGSFVTLTAFEDLAALSQRLRQETLVLGVVGPGDLLEDAVRHAPGGALFGAATVRRVAFDRLTGRGDGPLQRFVADGGRAARLTLLVRTVGHDALDPVLERVRAAARAAFPGAEAETTGELSLVLETQRYLLRTLALSLTVTLLAVGAIFRLLLPSTRLTLLALVPNLWPVVGVVGIMGWARVPLDVATVMVASVVLGLAVDDTIHTLGHFRELAPQVGKLEAVAGTLERTAPSYVLTGLILAAGFGVCALSDFAPISRFGALSTAAVALAVVGDLFLLPALLGVTPVEVVERLGRGREK